MARLKNGYFLNGVWLNSLLGWRLMQQLWTPPPTLIVMSSAPLLPVDLFQSWDNR